MTHDCDIGTAWDQRFAGEGYFYGETPNAFLAARTENLPSGRRVLLPGDGEGRNGAWLARRGHHVTAVDASARGLAKARALADRHGAEIKTEWADLFHWRAPEAAFDLIAVIYLHLPSAVRPALHANLAAALAPGGLLVVEGFSRRQLNYASGGPKDPDLLFTPESLRREFSPPLEISYLEEVVTDLSEGLGHEGPGSVVRMAARRV